MASFGLEVLRIFKERHNLPYRKRYKNLLVGHVSPKCPFNPNRNHLYFPESFDTSPGRTSPFYLSEMISNPTTIQGKDATATTIYFYHFLNWALWYYAHLSVIYNSLPKSPKQEEIIDARRVTTELAEMMEAANGKRYGVEEMKKIANGMYKKNNAPLKPSYFLKICRLFARAWYEEHFRPLGDSRKSVEFGFFTGCYIQQSLKIPEQRKCERFNGNNDYWKKEAANLFSKPDETLRKHFLHFAFYLERSFIPETPEQKGGYLYTIRISQTGCRHKFDLVAKLHHHLYLQAKNKP